MRLILLLCFVIAFPGLAQGAQRGAQLAGVVVDASGAPIAGAAVTVAEATVRTGADGTFALAAPPGQLQVRVTAEGFSPAAVAAGESTERLRVVMQPAPIEDRVLVTAARGAERLGTAGSQTTVTSAELLSAGAGSLDDALRGTPGFSLFRRSSSRVSNPTTQGVTLRGVFGSGASRTLVLADGVPLNDPFGSWVYWNRVPQAAIERVEVVRGATGDLYGADALGGVIQVLTFTAGAPRVRFTAEGGSLDTAKVSGFATAQKNGWFGEAAVEWLRTDGYITVGEEARGSIDVRADSDYQTGFIGGGYNAGTWHATARVSLYDEERGNGTPLQVNTTEWTQVAGEAGGTAAGGAWQLRIAGGDQEYFQTFTAVNDFRTSEFLTNRQTTPSRFITGGGQFSREFGRVAALVGAEGRGTRSTVEEVRTAGTTIGGGRETNGAVFGRVSFTPLDQLTIVAGARGDVWRSEPRNDTLPDHSAEFLSPRVSVAWRASDRVSLHGAAYRSHRTPTLNELYRGFRVGDIDTRANPQLNPETITGGEAGVLFSHPIVSTRVTVFTNQLENAVTNVTIGNNLRQRQNTDTIRATGVEVETSVRPHPRWTLGGLAAFTRSRFHETPEQPLIEGNRVPQVPTFQLGGTLTYADPIGFTGSLQARGFGAQYDDDLNQLELEGYGVVDFSASQQLRPGVNVFVAVENLFDKDYDVGRTPLRTVGWPRTARAGVRVFLP